MANPMTAASLVTALKRWHVTVVEHDGWRDNSRNHVGPWGPVHGSMVHHTASTDSTGIVEVCYNGRSDLPGPLCTGVIRKDGTVHLVGNGRTNHAGAGSTAVLDAVINETAIPARPGPDAVDGNSRFYGWECVNLGDGKDPWPEAQVDAIARVQAAICEHHGWSAQSIIGHLEWTTRKIDPRGFAMAGMRTRVAAHLTVGPNPMEGDGMALTDADVDQIADRVTARVWAHQVAKLDTVDTWSTTAQIRAPHVVLSRIEPALQALTGKVDALAAVELTDTQVAALASAVAANPALAEAIAERVAAKLADRLAS